MPAMIEARTTTVEAMFVDILSQERQEDVEDEEGDGEGEPLRPPYCSSDPSRTSDH